MEKIVSRACYDARQCAEVCSVAASAWFLCSVLSVPVTILSGDPISIPDVIYINNRDPK